MHKKVNTNFCDEWRFKRDVYRFKQNLYYFNEPL